jgi:ABC-2 type transport system permease protein
MRKVVVVLVREYLAAVRTKTFVLGLLIMPLMMGGSAILQYALRDVVDLSEKRYAVVDRTPGQKLAAVLEQRVHTYNRDEAHADGKQVRPPFKVEVLSPSAKEESDRQRYELSERVRRGQLAGFVELLPGKPDPKEPPLVLRYSTNRLTDMAFPRMAEEVLTKHERASLNRGRLEQHELSQLVRPVELRPGGLVQKDEAGTYREAPEQSRWASIVAPMVLMMLMFMVVLMGATPLMQGVVEEKMQRIAEVLLGSARPFELMLGKLLGMTAVSLTITVVYLGGAYWAGVQFGVVEYVGADLLAWFVFYQTLAALMFGSLFIAVGAACTDMKETQNLLWPVMLLAVLPVFLLGSVLREPNSPTVVALSFFPFATPMLMVTRMAVPPGIPWWQPALGAVPVLLTTVLCVWAAGRIFRVGILMQGKGARIGEMVKWVFRG